MGEEPVEVQVDGVRIVIASVLEEDSAPIAGRLERELVSFDTPTPAWWWWAGGGAVLLAAVAWFLLRRSTGEETAAPPPPPYPPIRLPPNGFEPLERMRSRYSSR